VLRVAPLAGRGGRRSRALCASVWSDLVETEFAPGMRFGSGYSAYCLTEQVFAFRLLIPQKMTSSIPAPPGSL
jgi:hypothetical protein